MSQHRIHVHASWVVVLAGVCAALQVGKLPPALPALQKDLGLSLVQSGFLLSMVQLAGLSLAVFMGLLADGMGLKRSMMKGLVVLALASSAGASVTSVDALLVLRAMEGLGFLLVVLPAPALIRRLVPGEQLSGMLGAWGAYMPTGMALALLLGPLFIPVFSWSDWWWLFACVSLSMAVWLWRVVPDDPPRKATTHPLVGSGQRLLGTLSARGPWLVALTFGVYSAQWLSVVGFLPSIYAAAGVTGAMLGLLTAGAAAVNMVGNLASGKLLQGSWTPLHLLWLGFAAMGLGSVLAFATFTDGWPWLRYAGVLLFSGLGGLVPGTLFSLAVRLAPSEAHVATTVGWMQQLSALGQFVGPPTTAALAAQMGGWHFTSLLTLTCCVCGVMLAWAACHALKQRGTIHT